MSHVWYAFFHWSGVMFVLQSTISFLYSPAHLQSTHSTFHYASQRPKWLGISTIFKEVTMKRKSKRLYFTQHKKKCYTGALSFPLDYSNYKSLKSQKFPPLFALSFVLKGSFLLTNYS